MKYLITTLLIAISLAACSIPPTAVAQMTSSTAVVPSATSAIPSTNYTSEEAEVRSLVENFGKRVQTVSLLSPDAAQEIQKQYAEFASPALLDMWMKDVSKAPGRVISSPWPDRIEITTLAKESSDKYVITGFVVEITSVEVVNGGAAAKVPFHIVAQKDKGSWLITDYSEEQQ